MPSRRLGRSLGINNIPPKICSYSCVYCQLGRKGRMTITPAPVCDVSGLKATVQARIGQIEKDGDAIDYLTFVPDGEPALDANLGNELASLRKTGLKTAVITNGSLLWQEPVRDNLVQANLVSVKVDAVSRPVWKKVNRPHKALDIDAVLEGITAFARLFKGTLITETMLCKNINDSPEELDAVSDFLKTIQPKKSYLAIPVRPPALPVEPADETTLNLAWQLFSEKLPEVEYLIGYEGDAFATTGNIRQDILSITSVHPMRRDAVETLLRKTGESREVISRMVENGEIIETPYRGYTYYLRKLFKTP